ncbi:MAG: membrane protein [Nitrospinaceae bacterium]|nr:MAG: membrane protein [Nitrospinaceae bacterium]
MKTFRHLIIGLAITAAALYYTLRNVSFQELADSFKTVDYVYLVPAVGILLLSFLFRALRWRLLMAPMKQVPVAGLFSPLMVGYMANILPARAGEFIRAYLLGKKHGIPFSGAFASIVVERLFDIVAILMLFAWVFVFNSEIFDSKAAISGVSLQTLAVRFGELSAVLVAALIGFIYMMIVHKKKLMTFIHWFTRHLPQKWHDKVEYLVEEFSLGCMVAKDVSALSRITLYTVLIWSSIVVSYYPFYFAYDLANKSLESVVVVTVLVCVLIVVLPTPAFLGSFNAAILIGLHDIMQEPEVTAVSFGMVVWAVNFGVIIAAGLYFVLHDQLSVKTLIKAEENEQMIKESGSSP